MTKNSIPLQQEKTRSLDSPKNETRCLRVLVANILLGEEESYGAELLYKIQTPEEGSLSRLDCGRVGCRASCIVIEPNNGKLRFENEQIGYICNEPEL